MPVRKLVVLSATMTIMAISAWVGPANGDPTSYYPVSADLYTSPKNNLLGIPSGQVNVVPGQYSNRIGTTNPSQTTVSAPVGDVTNMLGCAGVGQGEYTSGVYNMPESFAKFQQDVNSLLSRQILTMNYIMPQTAALFDQLNTYGNDRYQTFQQGCKVEPLKQDARTQYLNACVAKLVPERLKIIQQTMTGENAPKEPLLSSMAYAQAWEVCSNQYVSDTNAPQIRTDTLKAFAEQTRAVENVTMALQPLLCTSVGKNSENGELSGTDNGCWPTLLIPQVRLCLDNTLEGGCGDGKSYGIQDPQLNITRLFDILRLILDDTVIARRVTNFTEQLSSKLIDNSTLQQAASEAALSMSAATLARNTAGSSEGTMLSGGEITNIPEPSVYDFQLNYLNCKDPDILSPLKQYANKLNQRLSKETNPRSVDVSPTLNATSYEKVIKNLMLDMNDNRVKALDDLAWSSLGCTANQSIPIFDPNLMNSLNSCSPQDRYAFYAIGSYDVALTATRDIYRYVNMRLKQAHTKLLIEGAVPASGAAATSPTVSPELNNKLATVIKTVMIPYVEDQLKRLDENTNTRGIFAKRVQQIYTSRSGCISNPGAVQEEAKPITTGGGGGW